MTNPAFRNFLLLCLIILLASPTTQLYGVNTIKVKSENAYLTKKEKKKAEKIKYKVGRKVDKLKKKLEELKEKKKEEKKGQGMAIAGGILLLVGLITLFAGSSRSNRDSSSLGESLDNAAIGCVSVFAGLLLGIVGFVLLLVGLVVSVI